MLRRGSKSLQFLKKSKYFSTLWNANQYTYDLIQRYSQPKISLYDLLIRNHPKNNIALYFGKHYKQYTYHDIDIESEKLIILLQSIGVSKGARVAVLLPKCANLMIAAIAIWRLGAVYVPLFTAFGPDAIGVRIEDAEVTAIITDETNSHKLELLLKKRPIAAILTSSTCDNHHSSTLKEHFWISKSLSQSFGSSRTGSHNGALLTPSDPIALLYTSGTTGLPKGVTIPAYSLASFHMYMQYGLGLHCGDEGTTLSSWINPKSYGTSVLENTMTSSQIYQRYYSSADTGWAYGFYYNLIGPLLLGIPITYPAVGPFTPESLLKLLSDCSVTHFASSPSAIRALRALDMEEKEKKKGSTFDRFPTPFLSYSSSAGEPLSSTLNTWWMNRMTSHRPLADHYGQSEIGMLVNCHWGDCLLSNPSSLPELYPIGAMGRSMPGYRCVTLNSEEIEIPPTFDCFGQLAVDISASPLFWFQGYWNQPNRTAKCHSKSKKYYLTGDLVHQGQNPDEPLPIPDESLFWYISRNDDIITSSGYRIGPSDIERCLLKNHRVRDVGVYGVKDPEGLRGEIIVASIVLHEAFDNYQEEFEFTIELQRYVGENLSKHCKPKKILYRTTDLPRTPSGKIQRFKLREEFYFHK